MITFEHITDSRLFHMRSVAERVVELAQINGITEQDALQQLYVMGFVHDIGYAFDSTRHAHAGADVLRKAGYAHCEPINDHGDPQRSPDLWTDLLDAADMTTSPDGHIITYDERLADIAARYGESSIQYRDAQVVIGKVRGRIKLS